MGAGILSVSAQSFKGVRGSGCQTAAALAGQGQLETWFLSLSYLPCSSGACWLSPIHIISCLWLWTVHHKLSQIRKNWLSWSSRGQRGAVFLQWLALMAIPESHYQPSKCFAKQSIALAKIMLLAALLLISAMKLKSLEGTGSHHSTSNPQYHWAKK